MLLKHAYYVERKIHYVNRLDSDQIHRDLITNTLVLYINKCEELAGETQCITDGAHSHNVERT
jgi:hypothetical protein